MKKITKTTTEVIESSVSGIVFKVLNDTIESCIIVIGDNNKFSKPVQKLIVPARELKKELIQMLEAFVDERVEGETVVNPTISIVKKGKKKK